MLCRAAALLTVRPKDHRNLMGWSNSKKETSDFWWCLFNRTAQMKFSQTVSRFSQHLPEKFLQLSLGGWREGVNTGDLPSWGLYICLAYESLW